MRCRILIQWNKVMQTSKYKYRFNKILLLVVICFIIPGPLLSQDLEPRFLSPSPVGMNFAVIPFAYSIGNVLFDQALPLLDTEVQMFSVSPAFARSINIFGLSGQLSAVLPIVTATWNGILDNRDTSTTRTGFGDPTIAFAVDFIGAPALKGKEFVAHKQKTIIGAVLKVRIPLGQYNIEKFANLGTNRWSIDFRLGLAQKIGRFVLEGYLNAWFFTTNTNFFGGNTVAQDPIYTAQVHISYIFSLGTWAAVSYGQSTGGKTTINGEHEDNSQKNSRLGATFSLPISSGISLKFIFTSGVTTRFGSDFDNYIVAMQYRWGGI